MTVLSRFMIVPFFCKGAVRAGVEVGASPRLAFLITEMMSSARVSDNKKKTGRPPTGVGQLIGVRLQPVQLAAIDEWASAQEDAPTRPEAIRRLTMKALHLPEGD